MDIQILIVDDEKPARAKISRFLKRLHPDAELLEAGDGEEAIETIRSRKPDLILLDIQMPGKNGFDVIREVGTERMPPVIFVTAFDRYAVRAFEVQAVDYLLKPFDFKRFKIALDRALSKMKHSPELKDRLDDLLKRLEVREDYGTRLPIKSDERVFFVKTEDIRRIEAQGKYAQIHTNDAVHEMRATLQGLEDQLHPGQFCRIHRSHIVNIDHVKELQTWFHGDYIVILKDGTELRLSRRYSHRLLERL